MSQQRETATDRLVSIIQLTQLGRKTGVLTVRRGEGSSLEEGTITFSKGQVTQTSAGRRTGSEALNWLTTWGSCRFTFASTAPADNTSPLPSLSPHTIGETETPTQPIRQQLPIRQPPPVTPIFRRQTDPLPTKEGDGTRTTAPHSSTPTTPTTPFRTRQIDSALRTIENMGLSRAHRRLFLLVDGQRSIEELVRLMGRSHNEVDSLLRDLEHATVLHVPTAPPDKQ